MPFSRKTPPLNLPDDDGFCSVGGLAVDLGLYESSDAKPTPEDDAAKRDAKDAAIAELMKRVDALEVNQGKAKSMNAELMKRVDAIGGGQRKADESINEIRNQILNIADCVDALESRNPEPETVAAERTFTEAEVLAAMQYADERSATTISFSRNFAERLGIDLEAAK